ncbi:hypothetical protein [Moraxella lacunata]
MTKILTAGLPRVAFRFFNVAFITNSLNLIAKWLIIRACLPLITFL